MISIIFYLSLRFFRTYWNGSIACVWVCVAAVLCIAIFVWFANRRYSFAIYWFLRHYTLSDSSDSRPLNYFSYNCELLNVRYLHPIELKDVRLSDDLSEMTNRICSVWLTQNTFNVARTSMVKMDSNQMAICVLFFLMVMMIIWQYVALP